MPVASAAVDDGSSAFTSNKNAKFANEIFFFDFGKLASGEDRKDSWGTESTENNEANFSGKRIKDGDFYTYSSTDGLPAGLEVKVSVTNVQAMYDEATDRHGKKLDDGLWARTVSWNDFFRPFDVDPQNGRHAQRKEWFDDGVLYPSDKGTNWLISQYIDPSRFDNNPHNVGNQGYRFSLSVEGKLNGKRIPLDLIASDGESTGIRVEEHSNPYGERFPEDKKEDGVVRKGGAPENLGMVTNSPNGWEAIQDLVGEYQGKTRYYFVDDQPKVPTEVPKGKTPYPEINVPKGAAWSQANGDKSYGWVDTELTETPGPWKEIPQAQPLLVSRGATEIAVELNNLARGKTGSRQGIVAGIFLPTDQGDAPESYGEASHILSNWEVTGQPKGEGVQAPDVKFNDGNFVGSKSAEKDGGKNWNAIGKSATADGDAEEDVNPKAFKEGFETDGKVTIPVTAKNADVVAWVDTNNNGKFDNDERRVATVEDGKATFDWSGKNLDPGTNYYARIRVGRDGVNKDSLTSPTDTVVGGEVEDLKFTVSKHPSVSLGDRVWFDKDRDGLQGAGESGVPGVKVSLLDGAGKPVVKPGTDKPYVVVTLEDGKYLFEGLAKGEYRVKFDYSDAKLPEGLTVEGFTKFVKADRVQIGFKNSDVRGSEGLTDVIDLTADRKDIDAGLVAKAESVVSLGDRVWFDKDRDGLQGAGESGVPGVKVSLLDGAGKPVVKPGTDKPYVVVTLEDGKYLFEGLAKGEYRVKFDYSDAKLPEGLTVEGFTKFVKADRVQIGFKNSDVRGSEGLTDVIDLTADRKDIDAGLVAKADVPTPQDPKPVDPKINKPSTGARTGLAKTGLGLNSLALFALSCIALGGISIARRGRSDS
nr:SdrD B-like domain-containing protein [Arcanobacterium phocae]